MLTTTQRYTNENLRGIFKNNFELANFAIKIARKYIQDDDPKNLQQILRELAKISEDKRNPEGNE
jgi:hypothetical protein